MAADVAHGAAAHGPRVEVALETSRREASVAVAAGEAVILCELGAEAHASDLLPRLARALEELGIERRAGRLPLGSLYVGTGPGSYTGLRVGIATALGLVRASGAELYGLSSFEALAWAELEPGAEATVAGNAHAGRFYHARYRRDTADVRVLLPPRVVDARELGELCAHPGPILGHAGLAEAAGLAAECRERLRIDPRPSAAAVLALGRARRAAGTARPERALEPLYLREFAARGSPGH